MKLTVVGSAIFGVIISLIVLSIFSVKPSKNIVAVGPTARVTGEVNVPIFQPVDLTNMSTTELLNLRRSIVAKHNQLLAREYTTTGMIFDNIESKLPWFSIKGFFYLGHSPGATTGLSSEARHIVNPFVLVAPEFFEMSVWGGSKFKWAKQRITPEDLTRPEFPYYARPQKLIWNPGEFKAEVTYYLTAHLEAVQKWLEVPYEPPEIELGLVTYNARDLGFTHLAIDMPGSKGLVNPDGAAEPVELTSFLAAQANVCGVGSSCNHMAAINAQIDNIIMTRPPARLLIKLWRGAPKTADDPVHMRFDIVLQ